MPDSNFTRVLYGLEPIRPTFTRRVTADGNGKFKDTFSPNMTGRWDVTASTEEETTDPVTFYIFKSPPIKTGVIGPMEWIQGVGMREGAILAAEKINNAGGILGRKVVVVTGDEGSVPERGTAEMERLCSVEKVHFSLGGFRTEITDPMRKKAVQHRIPFSICGAATPWLIDCVTTTSGPHAYPCGECVGCRRDPARAAQKGVPADDSYKYLFRVTPTNTDVLFRNFLVPYLGDHLIPNVLQPALVKAGKLRALVPPGDPEYDPAYADWPEKVKVAVIIEALDWTAELRAKVDLVGPLFFGPRAKIVSKTIDPTTGKEHLYYSVLPVTKDFSPILAEIKERGARLIFHVFAGEEGLAFTKQWRDMKVPAVPVGINVMSQMSEMWDWTGGRCEYETFLATMGTKTPVSGNVTVKFWDYYTTRWGHAPIYTSFGAYESVIGERVTVEQATLDHPELADPETWEAVYENRTLYDIIIPYMEKMDRQGVLGKTKFTPTHDIYTGGWTAVDYGVEDYVKPLAVQWRSPGRMAAVSAGKDSHNASAYHISRPYLWYDGHTAPAWAPYIEEFQIPPWMLE